MATPCMHGSYLDKMNEAIVLSERKRARVTELGIEIGDKARAELTRDYAAKPGSPVPSESMLATVADNAIEKDARWRVACADEQWGYRLTQMYAQAELVLATRENTQVLKATYDVQARLLAEQRTTNELLRRLTEALTVPTDRPDPHIPIQPKPGFRGPAYDEGI